MGKLRRSYKDRSALGDLVHGERVKQDVTREGLAKLIGVCAGTIGRIETAADVRFRNHNALMDKLAFALGIDLESFKIDGSITEASVKERKQIGTSDVEFIVKCLSLDKRQRKQLFKLIDLLD